MKKTIIIFLFFTIGLSVLSQEKINIPIPNKAQIAWLEAELGVVFYYDLHVFDGKKYGQGGTCPI